MADREPVVVAGGGMAGLVTSLLLARSGRAVRLIERDLRSGEDWAADALQERRAGVAQYHQPHAFMPRAYTLLRDRLPDVLEVLLHQGATEIDLAPAGDPQAGDEDLVFLGVRRPLIEWALRGAVASEPRIALHAGRITGLRWHEGPPDRVCGVATDRGDVAGALVVDAMGRTSATPRWLAERGLALAREASDVGVVYYSRSYRLKDGISLPAAPSPFGPRVDHGFVSAATFIGDARTYCVVVMVPTWDTALKSVRHSAAFEAFCRATPALAPMVDPDRATPLGDVLPMGALQTVWHGFDRQPALGLVAVGDSFCHTDPSFALGMSNAFVHGAALADALAARTDEAAAAAAYYAAVTDELRERFEFARDVAAARIERMRGGTEPLSRSGSYPFWSLTATLSCAGLDPQVHRLAYRRHGYLDRLGRFDRDAAMQERVDALFATVAALMRQAPRLDRDALLSEMPAAPGG